MCSKLYSHVEFGNRSYECMCFKAVAFLISKPNPYFKLVMHIMFQIPHKYQNVICINVTFMLFIISLSDP